MVNATRKNGIQFARNTRNCVELLLRRFSVEWEESELRSFMN